MWVVLNRGVFRRRRATLSADAGARKPESLEEGWEMSPTFQAEHLDPGSILTFVAVVCGVDCRCSSFCEGKKTPKELLHLQ